MNTLFTSNTLAVVYGRKSVSIQRMLDFDYVCARRPSVAAIVDRESGAPEKVFYGKTEFLIPAYRTLCDVQEKHLDADVLVNFASLRSASTVVQEAMKRKYRVIATIAEGIRLASAFLIPPYAVGGCVSSGETLTVSMRELLVPGRRERSTL